MVNYLIWQRLHLLLDQSVVDEYPGYLAAFVQAFLGISPASFGRNAPDGDLPGIPPASLLDLTTFDE